MLDTSDIKIIFFDAGNVFVSDDPSGCFAYEQLYHHINSTGKPLSMEEFFRLRTEHAQNGGGLWSFVGQYIPESDFKAWQRDVRSAMYCQWSKLSPPIAAMQEVPRLLAPHYRLGILANQPAQMEDVLAERGLLQYFEILAISDKLNLHKPDTRLYQWAVDAARVPASAALMVGDRIDNDIVPARAIGMKTAWLRLGYRGRDWAPETEFQQHYAESISKSSYSECEPANDASTPDVTFNSAEELLSALLPTHAPAHSLG
jgi:FMN phosphatase YigB (HAD superfamily)